MKHLARLAVAILVAAGLPLLASSPAHAAACTRGTGVTVVVDGNQLGGLSTTCVPGSGRSGAAAFQAAGVGMTRVTTQPGAVCKVNGAPASQTCQRMPPATAYWSLWVSDGNGSWSYATRGVDSTSVPAGGWIAWSWQGQTARSAPSVTPQGPSAATKPPKRSSASSGTPSGGSGGGSGSGAGATSGGSSGTSGGSSGRSSTGGSAGKPRATASPSASTRDADGTKSDAKEAPKDDSGDDASAGSGADQQVGPSDGAGAQSEDVRPTAAQTDAGSGLGSWVAGLAVLAVLAAAGVTAWRRRPSR